MIRRALRTALGFSTAATVIASGWTLTQSPFTQPYRDRTEAELTVALDAALGRFATPEVVADRIATALSQDEADEAAAILRLADARGIAVDPALRQSTTEAEEAAKGWSACLACAISADNCPDLTRVAACNLPIELTPIGDAKAITRALTDYLADRDIDRIDLTLGLVGLGSTVAVVASGGSSLTVKAGATVLRIARKTGAVSKPLMDEIAGLAAGTLRLDRARDVLTGGAGASVLLDSARAARLTEVAADMGRLSTAMPAGDALAMLRYADDTATLARITRVAETAGPETRGTFAVLGKARVIRATRRLSELTMLAIGLLAALAAQVLALILWYLRRLLGGQRRASRPPLTQDPPKGPAP